MAALGECKWTAAELGPKVLHDLETFKLPAMRQAGDSPPMGRRFAALLLPAQDGRGG